MQAPEAKMTQKKRDLDVISVRRNPYLVDYEEQRRLQRAVNEGPCSPLEITGAKSRQTAGAGGGKARRPAGAAQAKKRRAEDTAWTENRRAAGAANGRNRRSVDITGAGSRRPAGAANGRSRRSVDITGAESRRPAGAAGRRTRRTVDVIGVERCQTAGAAGKRSRRSIDETGIRTRSTSGRRTERPGRSVDLIDIGRERPYSAPSGRRRNPAAAKKAAMKRRRKQMLQRRMMAAAWTICFIMVGWLILLKVGKASEAGQENDVQEVSVTEEETTDSSSAIVQGLSADIFAKHPFWEENFLPVNEYSRPGEALPEVNDIFVHYTANPGTSAAQNRSYFEQQKDMHEASVSAHFIIGYEGEIIQCVPLDEIAYAVQTRNYDSISIECCYKSEDGSFTQETYDSLIGLLAWLTDAYGLDTSHILRHYDCGGKKCPIYYTENEDAWARLKEDVAAR